MPQPTGFDKIDQDLAFLMEAFSEVLISLGEQDLAAQLPWRRPTASSASPAAEEAGQVFSIAFQLLNLVEENAASYFRAQREMAHGLSGERGLWSSALRSLKEHEAREEEIGRAHV